ncbi:hypothetical protein [Spirilliplanes yamanashiensis]|uniref:Uncharacterized protein n=1 Tax=Spirilliplanes yamanashiensis TaxID=42233 RepID=A0A8J3Y7I4_9ACTN|nr:hypothetical protein [Spirilliplanes yamanashiensis]MDP9815144.1 hypothetical protein [Spirilliplanes yamanashiensis]GIJ02799.1 hypothetical protein Sya03_21510 [Spirilliplanes yamanashiensis]
MTNLREHLDLIAGPAAEPSAADVDADIARGRRALRRRRVGQTLAGSAFAVAAAVAALSVAAAGGTVTPPGDRPSVTARGELRLVAYQGEQPKGFTVDTVPEGWFIQGDEDFNLVLAPVRAQNPGPDVDPSKAPIFDPRDYSDKIAIFLANREIERPNGGTPVTVGAKKGVLTSTGGSSRTLWVEHSARAYLVVQFWQDFGLSEDQMVELGAGVHVHPEAERYAG